MRGLTPQLQFKSSYNLECVVFRAFGKYSRQNRTAFTAPSWGRLVTAETKKRYSPDSPVNRESRSRITGDFGIVKMGSTNVFIRSAA